MRRHRRPGCSTYADDQTLVIVLSDHGFNSFQRGVHLNTWLHDNGLLALKAGRRGRARRPAISCGAVDWSRTKAYALGLGSIYLNLRGREAQGIVRAGRRAERCRPASPAA